MKLNVSLFLLAISNTVSVSGRTVRGAANEESSVVNDAHRHRHLAESCVDHVSDNECSGYLNDNFCLVPDSYDNDKQKLNVEKARDLCPKTCGVCSECKDEPHGPFGSALSQDEINNIVAKPHVWPLASHVHDLVVTDDGVYNKGPSCIKALQKWGSDTCNEDGDRGEYMRASCKDSCGQCLDDDARRLADITSTSTYDMPWPSHTENEKKGYAIMSNYIAEKWTLPGSSRNPDPNRSSYDIRGNYDQFSDDILPDQVVIELFDNVATYDIQVQAKEAGCDRNCWEIIRSQTKDEIFMVQDLYHYVKFMMELAGHIKDYRVAALADVTKLVGMTSEDSNPVQIPHPSNGWVETVINIGHAGSMLLDPASSETAGAFSAMSGVGYLLKLGINDKDKESSIYDALENNMEQTAKIATENNEVALDSVRLKDQVEGSFDLYTTMIWNVAGEVVKDYGKLKNFHDDIYDGNYPLVLAEFKTDESPKVLKTAEEYRYEFWQLLFPAKYDICIEEVHWHTTQDGYHHNSHSNCKSHNVVEEDSAFPKVILPNGTGSQKEHTFFGIRTEEKGIICLQTAFSWYCPKNTDGSSYIPSESLQGYEELVRSGGPNPTTTSYSEHLPGFPDDDAGHEACIRSVYETDANKSMCKINGVRLYLNKLNDCSQKEEITGAHYKCY